MIPKEKSEELVDKYIHLVPKEFGGMDISIAVLISIYSKL